MKYYTADLHLLHSKIIQYENRPFANIDEMTEGLVFKWNSKVKKGDEVYILGDFIFGTGEQANNLLDRLNGQKFLILGNHDGFVNDKDFDKSKFVWIKSYATVKDGGKHICLFHYPIAQWDRKHHGALHFYGHVHSNTPDHHPLTLDLGPGARNVGVDVSNFEPVSLTELGL